VAFFDQFHVGPNPHGDADQSLVVKIRALLEEFAQAIESRTENGPQTALQRPVFLFIDVDSESIHLAFTNAGAIRGFTSCRFYLHTQIEASHDTVEAAAAAVKHMGYPRQGLRFFSLPVELVEATAQGREEEVGRLADEYIKTDRLFDQMESRNVQMNPIFKGRSFNIEDSLCFVLMPFDANFKPVYEDHIVPALKAAGLNCLRADDIFRNTEIIEDIWEHINRARVIVADLTGRNPNVYYEVGIAHTVGKEVVLLTQSMDDIPFDLRHIRVIKYDFTPRGCAELVASLTATVRNIVQGHPTERDE
jgi:hypothetical protein